jgi:mono/diheme cytochrome c family protein
MRTWQAAAGAMALLLSSAASAADFVRQSYLLHCAGCHLPDGSGSAPNDVPSLHGIPGQLVQVPSGREFLAQVPGIVYSSLSDAEVAEILNWVLQQYSAAELPKDFVPYTAAEVAHYRAVRPASIMKVREHVLADLAARGIAVDYSPN